MEQICICILEKNAERVDQHQVLGTNVYALYGMWPIWNIQLKLQAWLPRFAARGKRKVHTLGIPLYL